MKGQLILLSIPAADTTLSVELLTLGFVVDIALGIAARQSRSNSHLNDGLQFPLANQDTSSN